MKSIKEYILENVANFRDWISVFTSNFKSSINLRYLDPEKDKKLIEEFINASECNHKLYRAGYIDQGNIWNTKEGSTCYEPVMSFSEDEKWVDITNRSHAYNDKLTNNEGYIMKIILNKGSKSLDISKYSEFPEQQEWITCGKFKVLKKYNNKSSFYKKSDDMEIEFIEHIVEVEQVFDEDLFDIFKILYEFSPQKKIKDYQKRQSETKKDLSESEIVDLIHKCNKKSISAAEKKRWDKKGIELTKEYLSNVLAKRIYSNGIVYEINKDKYNVPPYDVIYELTKKHNIKIKGAKRCGYNELDFPKTLK